MAGITLEQALGMEGRGPVNKVLRAQILEEEKKLLTPAPEELITNIAVDRQEVIEACRTQLNFLAAMAMPDIFSYMFSPTHLTAWQILVDGEANAEERFLQIALGIPRGHAKTTLIKLFLLYCILFTTRSFILVSASTEQHATNIIADLVKMMDEPNIKGAFGSWRLGIETNTLQLKKFGFLGRNIVIFGIGAEGAVRGTNINNRRPDVIVMDDIQTKEGAESPLQSKALVEWMFGTLMKAKSQHRCLFIFAGNMYASQHSILRQLKTNATWVKFISGAILADNTALWPEHRNLPSLIQELNNDIAAGQSHIFFAEVLNDTTAGKNANVDYSKFPEWPWTVDELPQGKFILIDPSQGKGKDFDVILRVEVYDAKLGVRDIIQEHYSPGNLIRKALLEAINNDIYCIAVEATAYQSTLLYWFEQVCKTIGISGIDIVPVYQNGISKNARIAGGIKSMQTAEVYLHPKIRSLVHTQIRDWDPMKRDNTDDILDAISNAPKVLADYTYQILAKSNLLFLETVQMTVRDDNHIF